MLAVVMVSTTSISGCIDSKFFETLAAESWSTPLCSWKKNVSFPSLQKYT
jgi:hypothetical protein